jgi:CrcB protein
VPLLTVLFVALGGFVGAPARAAVDRFVSDRVEADFPFGTFLVNVSGSFVVGLLTGLAVVGDMPGLVKALLTTGFCGAYTTFSTWTFETIRLVEEDQLLEAGLNVVLSLVVGLLAAGAGVAVVLGLR